MFQTTSQITIPILPTTPISLRRPPEALESGQNTTNSWRIPQMPPEEVAHLAAPWAVAGKSHKSMEIWLGIA